MIGSLLYLTTSRSDISFSVDVCTRFQVDPKESHLKAIKLIIRYIKVTADYGVWYLVYSILDLKGYTNSDWVRSSYDRKSTFGGCFYVEHNLIS